MGPFKARNVSDAFEKWIENHHKSTLFTILIVSFALRSFAMATRDLDLDEAFSYFFGFNHSFLDLISPYSHVITGDAHPPLHYVFTHFWIKSGYRFIEYLTFSREFAFRFPYALIGTLTAYTIYQTGSLLNGKAFGLFLSFLYCINSFSIQLCHQARMYPIVELLSAIILYQLLSLKSEFGTRRSILFAVTSSLLLLTHYSSAFYVVVVWIILVWHHRHQLRKLIVPFFVAVVCCFWWLPGLLTQISRETSATVSEMSTGIIVPFTLFHFLTGDRSLSLGQFAELIPHLWTITLFLIAALLLGLLFLKNRNELPQSRDIFIICIIPLVINWLATFKIHRVFNATYYGIYSLPAFLFLIALIVQPGGKRYYRTSLVTICVIFTVNMITMIGFFRNTLVPYEPWREVCSFIEAQKPQKVYVYPSHMSVLMRFYAPDLLLEAISSDADKIVFLATPKDSQKHRMPHKIFLVLSHDWGRGDSYLRRFVQIFNQKPQLFDYHNIRVVLFKKSI